MIEAIRILHLLVDRAALALGVSREFLMILLTRRRSALAATLCLLAASALLSGFTVTGKRAAPQAVEPLVDFSLAGTRTDDAIALLADKHGVRILFDEKMPERVSCTFRKIPLSEALLSLAGPDRYCVLRDGRTYRITRRLEGQRSLPPGPGVAGGICSIEPAAASRRATPADRPASTGPLADAEELDFLADMIQGGRCAEAEPVLEKLASRHPGDARVHALAGNAFRGRRMLVSAEKAWRRALELDPDNVELKNGALQLGKILGEVRVEREQARDKALVSALDAYLM